MSRDRTQEIRDEMLIEMARGIQVLLSGPWPAQISISANSVIGRLEAHIDLLRKARE